MPSTFKFCPICGAVLLPERLVCPACTYDFDFQALRVPEREHEPPPSPVKKERKSFKKKIKGTRKKKA